MDFNDIARRRYSCRRYRADPIHEADMQAILEAAELAPSAHNFQPFRLFVLPTAGNEEALARIYDRRWFIEPPLVLCVCVDHDEAWRRAIDDKSYAFVDAAIVMDHIILAATSRGLGTCWIAAFNPDAAREVLNLPPHLEPVVFTPLGFPADEMRERRRQPIASRVIYGRWQG